MKKLHIFGDSYSTPNFCVKPEESFWGLIAKDLQADTIINYSHSGYSYSQIVHLLLNERHNFQEDYFVIGIPPLVRLSMFVENNVLTKQPAKEFDKNFQETIRDVESTTGVIQFDYVDLFEQDKKFMAMVNHQWLEVEACNQIYLLHNYLSSRSAKFMILNLTIPFYFDEHWPVGKNIFTKVKNLKECVLFDNTFYSVNKDDGIRPVDRPGWPINYVGHHGAKGNANWYNKVVKVKMKELKWIQ